MIPKEIQKERDSLYKTIKEANDQLQYLRDSCNHVDYEVCNYQWRIGMITEARVCIYCGQVLSRPFNIDEDLTWL